MVGPFQRTVVLDITEFPSTSSRVDIAKCVNAKFDRELPVESIQFVPGGRVNVTFRSSDDKRRVESVEAIAIGSVKCRVVKPGPKLETVLVFHYPFESDSSALRRVFGSFGEVHDVSMQHYPDLVSVATGTRIVRMVRKAPIPRSVEVDDFRVKVWYRGQPVECDVCGKSGHVSRDCPLKGKCRRCLQSGHLARHCNNAPRAWDTVPLSSGSSVARPDPTPAEAAVAGDPDPDPDPVDPADFFASDISLAVGVSGSVDDWYVGMAVDDEDSAAASESPEASQSILADVAPEVKKSVPAAPKKKMKSVSNEVVPESPVVVAPEMEKSVPVAPKKMNVPVQCQSSVESLPDGQVVNTPLSDSANVLSSPAVAVPEVDVDDPRTNILCVPEGKVMTAIPGDHPDYPYCLVAKEYVLRLQKILAVDFPKKKILIQVGDGSQWTDAYVRRRR